MLSRSPVVPYHYCPLNLLYPCPFAYCPDDLSPDDNISQKNYLNFLFPTDKKHNLKDVSASKNVNIFVYEDLYVLYIFHDKGVMCVFFF